MQWLIHHQRCIFLVFIVSVNNMCWLSINRTLFSPSEITIYLFSLLNTFVRFMLCANCFAFVWCYTHQSVCVCVCVVSLSPSLFVSLTSFHSWFAHEHTFNQMLFCLWLLFAITTDLWRIFKNTSKSFWIS